MSKERDIDHVTGVETTGHEWDGIKELNKPLPKWWLYTFYACIAWAIGYWVLFPAWPTLTGYTRGTLGYSQRLTLAGEIRTAKAAQSGLWDQLDKAPIGEVSRDAELLRFATAGGQAAFQTSCAACHGRGAQGAVGYPNLNDDDWIWGGSIDDIHKTIRFGVRTDHPDTRTSQMPRFGLDDILPADQIADAADYVLSLSGASTDQAAAGRGALLFKDQCAACHGETAKGNPELGGPNLSDGIWLYGNSKQAIITSIRTGRGGVMPTWDKVLDPLTIKALAVYVHELGGGK